MKEEYLHQIWKTKRLPMHQLTLTDGRELNVRNAGRRNHESGPDFFNGSIELDGMTWNGNIEIHIKSSDWYAHKHHLDNAYNNVILHVVHKHDKPVFINGEEIPTLELKSMLDKKHWSSYESLIRSNSWIACEAQFSEVDSLHQSMQIESATISRLERKAAALELRFQILGSNLQQLQYEALAQSFGNKVNALPFIELTQRMPVKTIWREGNTSAPSLLLGTAGFLTDTQPEEEMKRYQNNWNFYRIKHQVFPMDKLAWKFKGLRPPGFPNIRITQFAQVIASMQQDFSFLDKPAETLIHFLKSHSGNPDMGENAFKYPLSPAFQNLILINSVAPLLWWYGNYKSDASYRQKALDLLEATAHENNEIIQSWKKLGAACKTAKDSQGLLELKHEMCDQKKCLECKIGNRLLGK